MSSGRRSRVACTLFGSVSLIVLTWSSLAVAQSQSNGSAGTIETIVVTAEKRSTDLEKTPMAITALSGEEIDQHQIRDLQDLRSVVPNFEMGDAQGIPQITIRGIGTSSFLPGTEGEAAVSENQVYVSRTIAQQTGLFDVSDIEVLRGPQGTLYGRNATAGAVNITTNLPTNDYSGYARATVGNYGEVRLDGAEGGPVDDDDTLLIRLAGFFERHDGYGTNLVTHDGIDDKNAYGLRGTVVFKPTSNITATLIAEYYDENDHQGAFHYFSAGGLSGLPVRSASRRILCLPGATRPRMSGISQTESIRNSIFRLSLRPGCWNGRRATSASSPLPAIASSRPASLMTSTADIRLACSNSRANPRIRSAKSCSFTTIRTSCT